MKTPSRTYDKEFKVNAVRLYKEGNKGLDGVAGDLGIPMSTWYAWVKAFEDGGAEKFSGFGNIKPSNIELYKLKREIADVTMERDTLKTRAIFLES